MSVTPIACDPLAWVSVCCKDAVCGLCGQPATARVVEEIFADDPFAARRALAAFVCASHFLQLMGPAGVAGLNEYRSRACGAAEEP